MNTNSRFWEIGAKSW